MLCEVAFLLMKVDWELGVDYLEEGRWKNDPNHNWKGEWMGLQKDRVSISEG